MAVATSAVVMVTACGGGGGADASDDESSGGEAVEPVVWRWEHGLALAGTVFEDLNTEQLPAMIEEATDGKLVLDIVYGENPPADTLSAVQAGRVDGGFINDSSFSAEHPLWNYGESAVAWTSFEQFQEGTLAAQDIVTADVNENDVVDVTGALPYTETAVWSGDAIRTLDDWQGLRVRATGIGNGEVLGLLGGSPVNMPFAEVYPALETGAIDGFMTAFDSGKPLKPWEVAQYINRWPIGWATYRFVVNPDSLEALDPEVREQALQAFEDFADLNWEETGAEQEVVPAFYESMGNEIIMPDETELAGLDEWSAELRDLWLERVGPDGRDVADEIIAAIE